MAGNLPGIADMPQAGFVLPQKSWIALGSNLGNGGNQLRRALELLQANSQIEVLRISPMYRSKPVGIKQQPDFTNAVAELSVTIGPFQLLQLLKSIEQKMGRLPGGPRWGPRNIDLDILLFGGKIFFLSGLTIPHPRMHQRPFVLVPLLDLEPELKIPARGRVKSCLQRLRVDGMNNLGVKLINEQNPK